jgi:hypothetical protein
MLMAEGAVADAVAAGSTLRQAVHRQLPHDHEMTEPFQADKLPNRRKAQADFFLQVNWADAAAKHSGDCGHAFQHPTTVLGGSILPSAGTGLKSGAETFNSLLLARFPVAPVGCGMLTLSCDAVLRAWDSCCLE